MSGCSLDSSTVVGVDGQATVWTPRTPRVNTCGLILFPGQSSPRMYADGYPQRTAMWFVAQLAAYGIPLVTCEFYGDSWAKDEVMDDAIPAVRALLESRFPLMRTDKIGLFGISHGGAAVARYSQLHPDEVSAAIGLAPAFDPKAIYINNDVGDAAMEAAWGFTDINDFPDALDLGPKAALASSVPLMSAYSSDDSVVPPASVIAYHALADGLPENLINLGPVGHTIGALQPSTVAQFLVANGS